MTWSGQPWRRLAASATSSRVARSCRPQISVVGTAIRAGSLRRDRRHPTCAIRLPSAPIALGVRAGRRCTASNGSHRSPISSRTRSRSSAHWRHSPSCVSSSGCARKRSSAAPNVGRGLEGRQPERVDEHQPAEPVAVVGREAERDGAAERVADEHRRRRAGALDQLAEPGADPLGVQLAGVVHASRRRGRAGRGRSRGASSRGPGSRASSAPRSPPGRAAAPPAGRRRPRARRSRRPPAGAGAP